MDFYPYSVTQGVDEEGSVAFLGYVVSDEIVNFPAALSGFQRGLAKLLGLLYYLVDFLKLPWDFTD